MGVLITTAATSPEQAVDRAPDGRLWFMKSVSNVMSFWYSDNDGATWAQATGTFAGGSGSLFVDQDGGLNVAYQGSTQGFSYRRGTVSGTTITWTDEFSAFGNWTGFDLVAFRDPGGNGHWALITVRSGDGDNPHLVYRVRVAPGFGGVVTVSQAGIYTLTPYNQGGSGFNGDIDFHHTGDGKTVQGGTPHVYVAFVDAFGAKYLVRLIWNGSGYALWHQHISTGGTAAPLLVFDGTRPMVATSEVNGEMKLWEIDAANTAKLSRGSSANMGGGAQITAPQISYDRVGNIYLAGVNSLNGDLYWTKWTRATNTWDGSWTLELAGTFGGVDLRKGWAFSNWPTIEGVYWDATSAYYQEVLVVNATPNAPGVLAPADGSVADVAASLGIIWQFNDPDQGDEQSAYTVRRRIGAGAFTYWNGTSWAASESGATKIASGGTSLGVAAGWGADGDADHFYSVKTWDSLDQLSPWSAEHRVIPSAKDNPTITVPASDGTDITTANFNVEWTVATQTRYRLRVVGSTAGAPNLSVVDFDSGIRVSTSVRLDQVEFPVNGQVRHIELTTWNDEGLQSNIVYRRVDVAYTPPAAAAVSLDVDSLVPGAIVVNIENIGTGAAEDHNDVFRRVVGDTGPGIRIAAGIDVDGGLTDYAVASGVDYEYQVKTYATSGAVSFSSWEDGT